MKLSKKTTDFAYSIISNYSHFDKFDARYVVDVDMLPEFELTKLASMIYSDCPEFATESTGPDNDQYDKHMMPALLVYLKNPTSKDARIDFDRAWLNGVTNYASDAMKGLLEEMLGNFNQDMAA